MKERKRSLKPRNLLITDKTGEEEEEEEVNNDELDYEVLLRRESRVRQASASIFQTQIRPPATL